MTGTCLITGGSRGIGLATALRFAKQGYRVMLTARDGAALSAAQKQVAVTGAACEFLAGDVGSADFAARLVAATVEKFGSIDVLVNNAGVAPLAPIPKMAPDEFERLIDTNIRAVFHVTRAVWPHMQQQKHGTIVNISSVAAFDAFPGLAAYGATKAWINAFTRSAAEEGRPESIRVFAIAPGAVETRMLRSVAPDMPRNETLDPDDVAAAIEAVCDRRLACATGQTIVVRR